jgi:hypothetical protein
MTQPAAIDCDTAHWFGIESLPPDMNEHRDETGAGSRI